MRVLRILSIAMLTLTACSSSTTGTAGGGGIGEGGACASGHACASGLYCFVAGPEPMGVCNAAPAACGTLSCSGACGDALDAKCGSDGGVGSGARCQGILGKYTIGCSPSPPRRNEGQTCSTIVGCVAGTYCDIKDPASLGTCTKLPATCATDPSCDCLRPIFDACPGGHSCSVGGDVATVQCL